MSGWVNFNGSLREQGSPLISADSRALRYGDGLFETMRFANGTIKLRDLHFERLFSGMKALHIGLDPHIDRSFLEKEVLKTIAKNKVGAHARIRLTVFRGEGGLHETDGPGSGFIVQTWPQEPLERLNENGFVTGIYREAKKHCDGLSNIKSNNYLLYVMAALHAQNNRWNDCLVLNHHDRVCDATIANIFWVKEGSIFTPPLSEGGVAGVMRRHLLEKHTNYDMQELPATVGILEQADEIFLTNAISGICWVKEFNGKTFTNRIAGELFRTTF